MHVTGLHSCCSANEFTQLPRGQGKASLMLCCPAMQSSTAEKQQETASFRESRVWMRHTTGTVCIHLQLATWDPENISFHASNTQSDFIFKFLFFFFSPVSNHQKAKQLLVKREKTNKQQTRKQQRISLNPAASPRNNSRIVHIMNLLPSSAKHRGTKQGEASTLTFDDGRQMQPRKHRCWIFSSVFFSFPLWSPNKSM